MSKKIVQNRINEFENKGYIHEKNFYSQDFVESIKLQFDKDFLAKKKRFFRRFNDDSSEIRANHDKNRWNMLLESNSEFVGSEFYANPIVFDLLQEVFDGDFSLVFLSSDISSPGSSFQTIHQDGNEFAVALNLPLVESNEHNGSTQVFPFTHRTSSDSYFSRLPNSFTDAEVIERVSEISPLHLNLKKGDFTIRDLRLIHRGTPNHSDIDRPYLSAVFLPVNDKEMPTFEVIEEGLRTFMEFKDFAFSSGRIDLIDYANTFGRLVMVNAMSDRIARPIPKNISDELSVNAKYCLRFAKFEDDTLNHSIERTSEGSEMLLKAITDARLEFEALKSQ